MNKNKPIIAITLGDPSGIGTEIICKSLLESKIYEICKPLIIGSSRQVKNYLMQFNVQKEVSIIEDSKHVTGNNKFIEILEPAEYKNINFPLGKVNSLSGKASHLWVEIATTLCMENHVNAMVTAPINKESWFLGGSKETGHQEVLKRISKSDYVATMLVSGRLRCMHLSTHKTLLEACKYVTKENVLRAIKLTDSHFKMWGIEYPKIAVAALNPHASDNGLIGDTEQEEISPSIELAKELNINVTGPYPADSIFNSAIEGKFDVVIVMYHDQGHIPIKVHGLEKSVSINLGLPFIRTSVDHGTAFDIAGKNIANETSMIEAIKLSVSLSKSTVLNP